MKLKVISGCHETCCAHAVQALSFPVLYLFQSQMNLVLGEAYYALLNYGKNSKDSQVMVIS